ncbi:portal protein [Arthrobacter phage Racecar]|nr:portal protein [Arthrobacter phage Racecar]QFG12833.1 portal protein [Arthrobacter phage Mimi]
MDMPSIFGKQSNTGEPEPNIQPQKFNAPRPLTASAARVDLKNKKEIDAIGKRRKADSWQQEAWEYFDLIGEIKYSANLVANVMSRINLYTGYVEDSSGVPSDIRNVEKLEDDFIQDAQDILYLLESGNGGTSGLLRNAALNLFLVGECYLVHEPTRFTTHEPAKYQIRSIDEIVTTAGRNSQVCIKPRRDSKPADFLPLPANGYISRMWRNHPRYSDEADSSMRGILDLCDELLLGSRAASATAKSRLNAGLLFVPDGLSNVTQSDGTVGEDGEMANMSDDVSDSFEEELIDAMTTPIADVGSASSVVPLVVRGPEDLGEKITHIKFERTFDPQLTQRGDRLIERILAGLDIPKDIAAGMSNVKYSNAIIIEEQLYKAHIEPLILLIVDCLTIGFLRPALRAQGYDEKFINRAVVWYDPSAISAKPSKAESAITLYEKGAISLEALRKAHGFTADDAPAELERAQRIAIERGNLTDAMSETLLNTVIPEDLKNQARQDALAMSDPSSANALQNALGGDPTAPAPATDPTAAPVDSAETAPSDTMEPMQNNDQTPPPTLMEP